MIRPTVVQLVDALADHQYVELRTSHPHVALMQVIHVRNAESVREAVHVAPFVDAMRLNSGDPSAAVKELGGTGRVHDWRISRRIREAVGVPVFLAGGLRPPNVADAIDAVRPYGVGVCSGVRTGGALDAAALHDFMCAARA